MSVEIVHQWRADRPDSAHRPVGDIRRAERMVVEGPMPSPGGRDPGVRSVRQREYGDVSGWRLITDVPLTR